MKKEDIQAILNEINPALDTDVRNWLTGISVEAHDIEIDSLVTGIEQRVLAAMTGDPTTPKLYAWDLRGVMSLALTESEESARSIVTRYLTEKRNEFPDILDGDLPGALDELKTAKPYCVLASGQATAFGA